MSTISERARACARAVSERDAIVPEAAHIAAHDVCALMRRVGDRRAGAFSGFGLAFLFWPHTHYTLVPIP